MPPQTSSPGSLDPQAVALAKAIRQTESGGNPTATGKSGEYGAYQYTEPTWAKDSASAGVNVPLKQATLEQQNQVAYAKIKALKDKGFNVGQVASSWNAGEGEHDAYTGKFSNGQPSVGTNKYGAKFDVPAYAKSVATAYQTLKQGGQVSADPNNPSSTANQTPVQDPNTPDTYGATFPASAGEGPVQAGLKAVGNVPSSIFNLGKGLVGAAMHPIKTVEGVGSALVGGASELGRSLGTGANVDKPKTKEEQTFDALKKALYDRYGTLENAQRSATNDPAGVGADVLSILEGGAAGLDKLAGTSSKEALNSTLSAVAKPVVSGIKSVASAPFKLASGTLGLQTGVGATPIKEGFSASAEGGDASKAFMEGLRGKTSPEDLVDQARGALGEVVQNRGDAYKKMLSTLGEDKTTYDISPIYKTVDDQLSKFGIAKAEDGTLDFSRSKFALDTTAQKDIQALNDYVTGGTKGYNAAFGSQAGDRTALGIDNLKQVLGGYYSPNSDYRAFTEALRKSTRSILDNAPGYTEEMSNYSDLTDKIKDIKQSLSLGDKASVETSFKKLTSALKNNEFRAQVLKDLDQTTGGNLLPKIAGYQLNSVVPRGLAGVAEGGIASVTGLVSGIGGLLPLLGLAITTSPRIVGEFIHALGLGARGTKYLMGILNKFAPEAVLGGNAANRGLVNPSQLSTGNPPLVNTQQ